MLAFGCHIPPGVKDTTDNSQHDVATCSQNPIMQKPVIIQERAGHVGSIHVIKRRHIHRCRIEHLSAGLDTRLDIVQSSQLFDRLRMCRMQRETASIRRIVTVCAKGHAKRNSRAIALRHKLLQHRIGGGAIAIKCTVFGPCRLRSRHWPIGRHIQIRHIRALSVTNPFHALIKLFRRHRMLVVIDILVNETTRLIRLEPVGLANLFTPHDDRPDMRGIAVNMGTIGELDAPHLFDPLREHSGDTGGFAVQSENLIADSQLFNGNETPSVIDGNRRTVDQCLAGACPGKQNHVTQLRAFERGEHRADQILAALKFTGHMFDRTGELAQFRPFVRLHIRRQARRSVRIERELISIAIMCKRGTTRSQWRSGLDIRRCIRRKHRQRRCISRHR